MEERTGIETIGVFLLATGALFLSVWPGLELVFFAIRGGVSGLSKQGVDSIGTIATLLSILLGAWFLDRDYSIKRIWLYTVAIWAIYYALFDPAVSTGFINSVPDFGATILLLVLCGIMYLLSYVLIYREGILYLRRITRT